MLRRSLPVVVAAALVVPALVVVPAPTARAETRGEDTPLVAPSFDAAMAVEVSEKSPVAALAWELFIPGAGNLYAHDLPGAITTWVLMGGGMAVSVWGLSRLTFPDSEGAESPGAATRHEDPLAMPMLLAGLGFAVFGRIHGFVSAWGATERYNDAHLSRSGLALSSLSLAPVVSSENTGVLLGGRF